MRLLLTLFFLSLLAGCGNTSKQNQPAKGQDQPAEQSAADSTRNMIGHIEQMEPELSRLLDVEARPEVIGEGYAWSEGPVWVEEHQFLLFSDIPNNIIHKWKQGEGVSDYLKPAGYTGQEERGGELGSN